MIKQSKKIAEVIEEFILKSSTKILLASSYPSSKINVTVNKIVII